MFVPPEQRWRISFAWRSLCSITGGVDNESGIDLEKPRFLQSGVCMRGADILGELAFGSAGYKFTVTASRKCSV
jgi:hypothetical protein